MSQAVVAQRTLLRFALPRARIASLAAAGLGPLVAILLIVATGAPLKEAMAAFWEGVAGSPEAMVGSINRAVPLALVGLGYLLASRANLTNVGGEGQIAIGGMCATALALHGSERLPSGLAFMLPMLAGALGGALWGGLAGVLKARRGSNEVITTLLLTFIALQMVYGAVQSEHLLRQPRTDSSTLPESLELALVTQLPLLVSAERGLPLHIGLLIEALALVAIGVLLAKSALGLKLRAVGLNQLASRRAGIAVDRVVVAALAASGALGGLAGAIMIQGDQHYLTSGFSSGFGFDGLVVGLLARGSAPAVAVCALLFGCLRSGGMAMEMTAQVPSSVVLVCQGLIVIAIAATATARTTSQGGR